MVIKRGENQYSNQHDDPEIFLGDAENIAEERGFDVAGKAPIGRDDGHAEGKAGSRDHADGGVGSHPAPMADQVNEKAGEQRPQPRADKKVDVHHIAENRAAEDGVGETVADVAHPAQDDVNADEATERADEHGGDETVAKELVLKGKQQKRHYEVQIVQVVQAVQIVTKLEPRDCNVSIDRRFERLERLERLEP